jgi:hypothetical protein
VGLHESYPTEVPEDASDRVTRFRAKTAGANCEKRHNEALIKTEQDFVPSDRPVAVALIGSTSGR